MNAATAIPVIIPDEAITRERAHQERRRRASNLPQIGGYATMFIGLDGMPRRPVTIPACSRVGFIPGALSAALAQAWRIT